MYLFTVEDTNKCIHVLMPYFLRTNFPLHSFWGESPNAIKMQVYCVLIAQLLMVVIRKSSYQEVL